jgi:RNA recognition motif-containing protein
MSFSLTVILPMRNRRPAGFGFVHFKTEEAAKNAVEKLDESGELLYPTCIQGLTTRRLRRAKGPAPSGSLEGGAGFASGGRGGEA